MTLFNRLYISIFINTFGSWLTFLAIALVTQERYGTQYVAIVFALQTLPAIFLSRSLAKLVPEHKVQSVYFWCQIGLALNCFVLALNSSLVTIFIHLLVGSVLKSLSQPLFNGLIGKWIPENDQKPVFTRIGALQAGTLALAPVVGAWLKIMTSVSTLFVVDGLSFIIGVVVLKELFLTSPQVAVAGQKQIFKFKNIMAEFSPRPQDIPTTALAALQCWFLFLIVGALLNAIEFPGFAANLMTETQIGYALAAWGCGNFFAFLFPVPLKQAVLALLYVGSLALFVFSVHHSFVLVSFALAGAFSSYFAGAMRAQVQQAVPPSDNAVLVWAYANQVTQFINLVAYASAGFLLTTFGFRPFGLVMLGLGLWLYVRLVNYRTVARN